MFSSDFNVLCPIHGFLNECQLDKEQREALSLPNQLKAFLAYPFQNESIKLAEKIHTICSHYNIRVFDALIEPGSSIMKSCKICRLALSSNFGIAILSPLNYNVMFEIGFLYGLQKNVLFLIDSSLTSIHDIPFDLGDRILVAFDGINNLENHFRKEFPDFLKLVHKSLQKERESTLRKEKIVYKFKSVKREDELHLDGTQMVSINYHMIGQGDMPGFLDNIYTVSEKHFPFKSFEIDLLSYDRTKEGKVEIQILEKTKKSNEWRFIFDPPLSKGEELLLKYKFKFSGHRIMCIEDLLEVAKYKKEFESVMVHVWRTVSVPTEYVHWKFKMPKDYDISNAQPYVSRARTRIRSEEIRIEKERIFKKYNDDEGNLILDLKLNDPTILYNYGFAWLPPTKGEYEMACNKYGVTPLISQRLNDKEHHLV